LKLQLAKGEGNGRGQGLKAEMFKEKYVAKSEFPESWNRGQTNKKAVGWVWIFS